MEKQWQLYILRCGGGTLYTGIAVDAKKRLAAHRSGRGAKYTRGRGPLRMVYCESGLTHSEALRREAALKRLPREEKKRLIAGNDLYLENEKCAPDGVRNGGKE